MHSKILIMFFVLIVAGCAAPLSPVACADRRDDFAQWLVGLEQLDNEITFP